MVEIAIVPSLLEVKRIKKPWNKVSGVPIRLWKEALQSWIRDNLLSVDSWYSEKLSVLTLTIECPGCDFVFASVFVLVLFGFQSEISKV